MNGLIKISVVSYSKYFFFLVCVGGGGGGLVVESHTCQNQSEYHNNY